MLEGGDERKEERAPPVDPACANCRFAKGEDRACVFIETGDQKTLFDVGPCELPMKVLQDVRRLVMRRFPFAAEMADDLASEVVLAIVTSGNLLVPGRIRHLRTLKLRLSDVMRNATIDALRKHRLVSKVRCGACVHYQKDGDPVGCHLEYQTYLDGQVVPNPWYGDRVNASSDPRSLAPACDSFEWRKPAAQELAPDAVLGGEDANGGRNEAIRTILRGIDQIALTDMSGLKAASILYWHYLHGRDVATLAEEHAVSEKTIKRLLADGRRRLAEVLQDEANESPEELPV